MIESIGPRPIAPNGPASIVTAIDTGEKVVHRPDTKVLAAEKIDKNAPTGPRPTFQHTYLEKVAALWPEDPDKPEGEEAMGPETETGAPERKATAAETGMTALRKDAETAEPTVDLRR